MLIDYDILPDILTWATILFFIYFFLYRKYVSSVFDPVFFNVWGSAFSGVMVLYVVQEQRYINHYFICQLFLFLGFIFVQKILPIRQNNQPSFHFYDRDVLVITVYILFGIYIVANVFIIYLKGAALFSNDPTARETNFEEGLGIFRRINWGIGSFLSAGFVVIYLTKPKRIFLFLLLVLAFFTALEGTKSALLRIVGVAALLIYHPFFINDKIIVNKLKKYAPIGVIALGVVFFSILAKESSGGSDLFLSFIKRLLAGADSVVYFYLPQNEYLLTAYQPVDYILYVLNPILGFFHLVPYIEPFGSVMVGNIQIPELRGDNIYLAPNTPFYIEGQIFFGYYGAFIFSFFIGCIFSYFRQLFFSLTSSSYFTLALFCTIFFHALPIPNDFSLFIRGCLDTCLFALPVYLIVCLVIRHKMVFRKLQFGASDQQHLPIL